jgi:hypothetical protein
MRAQAINRVTGIGLIVLALVALATVLTGFTQPPQPDEGAAAHVFQLSIVALVPATAVFVATADWTTPSRSLRPLALAAVVSILAFGALYILEHVR